MNRWDKECRLPKLRVRYTVGHMTTEKIVEFQQARTFTYGSHGRYARVTAEGHPVYSYGELVRLAHGRDQVDKEFIDIVLQVPLLAGG